MACRTRDYSQGPLCRQFQESRFERSLVQTERDDLAVELERILTTGVGAARLHYNPEPAAARGNVRGVAGKSMGQIPTYIWNIHDWTVG